MVVETSALTRNQLVAAILPSKPESEIRTGGISAASSAAAFPPAFAKEINTSNPLKCHIREGPIWESFVFVEG